MLELIIALFGGAFLLSKIGAEKANTIKDDIMFKHRMDTLSKIELKFDAPLSYKWYRIQNSVNERIQMLNDVSEELQYIFGTRWRKMYEEYILNHVGDKPRGLIKYWMSSRCIEGNIWVVAYNIWLSKKGFVDTACWHLVASKKEFCVGLPRLLSNSSTKNAEYAEKYINTILNNLTSHHPDLNLSIRCRDDSVYVITCPYGDLSRYTK